MKPRQVGQSQKPVCDLVMMDTPELFGIIWKEIMKLLEKSIGSVTRKMCATVNALAICLALLAFCIAVYAQNAALTTSARALYQGDYPRAAQIAEKHLHLRPDDATVRVMLARAVLAQGKFEIAFTELQKVLRDDPKNIDALYYLNIVANVLSQQHYQRLYALSPDSERVHQLMGEAALVEGNPAEAESEFLAALRVNPRSVEVLTSLGELKRTQSEFDEALTFFQNAADLGAKNFTVIYGLGVCHAFQQNHAEAAANFRQAVALNPGSADARFALGNELFQLGRSDEALKELTTVVAGHPKMKQAWFLMGRAHQRLGRTAESKAAFKKVEDLTRQEIEQDKGTASPGAASPAANAPTTEIPARSKSASPRRTVRKTKP